MMFLQSQTFNTTAVKSDKCYHHFGIHPKTASLYGDKVEDIIDLKFKIHEDQTRPGSISPREAEYWGYYEINDKRFSLIYPQFFLLDMCFPSGIEVMEERGFGKAFKLQIL